MTDECCFTRNGISNYHNSHVWAYENPHAIHQSNFQQRFQINVWAGIIGNNLIGPTDLDVLLEDVPLETIRQMWFMHDAPPHYSRQVREDLDHTYPHQWIGRGGPVSWPPRSPDLNSSDFFL